MDEGSPGVVPDGQDARPLPKTVVRVGLLFYAGMGGLALLWRVVLYAEPLWFVSAAAASEGVRPGRDVTAGLLAGAGVLAVSWAMPRGTRWGARLARVLGEAVGPRQPRQCLWLALASGFGEEMLFRGALQPRVGWIAASLIFGLLHFIPRRAFLPWAGFAVAAGLLFGWLYIWTGNLLAPILAHVLVNAVNLPLLVSEAKQRSRLDS